MNKRIKNQYNAIAQWNSWYVKIVRKGAKMKKKNIFVIIILLLITALVYIHRRAIRALIKGEPMPKAPSWHIWVPEKNRIQG